MATPGISLVTDILVPFLFKLLGAVALWMVGGWLIGFALRLLRRMLNRGSLDPTFHRDDLERIGTRLAQPTDLPVSLEGRQVVLVDDVIFTGRTVRAALEALQAWGRPERVSLLAMVDRGHRELPIQPDFCGKVVPTSRQETIQLALQAIDGEEGVFLLRP